ncbi:MAG TPA: MFS transporter [Clostridiales bacterium UBA8960]|nr:MFS transporter [Clostridiales bacterium UBA8960]
METTTQNKNWKKETALFLAGQTVSIFGTSLVQYAILWYITLGTQSGVMMMISVVVGFLPTFFLAPFAGVWADRFDRKKLIIIADLAIALTTLIAAILFWSGHDGLWILFTMSGIRAFGTAVQTPAVGAFLPQIVPEDKLMRVNGINGSLQSIIMIASPMISGALLTFSPISTIFMIDVVTAVIAVSILVVLKVAPHAKALEKGKIDYFSDLKEGVKYVREHSFLTRFFIFTAFFNIFITPAATLTPLQTARTFGADVWRLTAIEIAFSVGMLFGGIIIASWGGFKNRMLSMAIATFILGGLTVALGLVPIFWIYVALMALIGIVIPLFNTPATVLLQEKVESAYLGNVFGVMTMIYSSMMPLGMIIFGPLADIIAIEWLLIITGTLIAVQGFFLLGSKVLMAAGEAKTS